jgi:hypothetical protein
LTSFSVVTVVFPPGVETCVSVFEVDFSAQPARLNETMLKVSTEVMKHFMSASSFEFE